MKTQIKAGLSLGGVFVWIVLAAVAQPAAYPVQTKVVDGVRSVMNPVEPRDGVFTPKYVEEWSVGGENDPQGELVNRPFEVRIGTDGLVYILDWGDTCIRIFDAKGKFVRQVGRKGQGPGEIDTPAYLDVTPAGEITILDSRNMRISRFAKDGTFLKSFRMDKFSSLVRTDGLGRIYRGEESTAEPSGTSSNYREIIQTLTIVRTDVEGGNPKRFGPFIGRKFLQKSDGAGVMMLGSQASPTTGWGVDRNGGVYAGYNEKYEVGVYDSEGKILFRFGRKFEPVKNPRYKPSTAYAQPENQPAFNPEFFFDETGNIWLPLFRAGDKDPFLYDIFSPEGIYIRQIVVPFRIYRVWKGNAYAVVETEEGFKAVKCYRLDFSGPNRTPSTFSQTQEKSPRAPLF